MGKKKKKKELNIGRKISSLEMRTSIYAWDFDD